MAINNVKAVLVDLSGTIHIEDTEIPGSIKALQRYSNGRNIISFFFVVNFSFL